MKKLLIWGAGDQGTVTLDCALLMKKYDKIDFLDIREKGHREIPDYIVYQEKDVRLRQFLKSYDAAIVATGDNTLREAKTAILNSIGIPLATIIHPTAIISPTAKISEGCTILANAVINTNASIGIGCIVNTATIIEHDCLIEDFVNISPRTAMAGHTKIGRKTFLGIGCTIIDGIEIDQEVIVGAGAVVIQNIPECTTAVGIPAKVIKHNTN